LEVISGYLKDSTLHVGKMIKHISDFSDLVKYQLITTLPFIMMECLLHGIEISGHNSLLIFIVVSAG
jgi:hypothetical protein